MLNPHIEPVQPARSSRFTVTYATGMEEDIFFAEPLTLDEAADRVWSLSEKFDPSQPKAIAGITIMCDRADPSNPCTQLAGHDGDCTTPAPPDPTPLRTGGVYCSQHGANSQCGVLCAMRYRR